MIEKYLQALRNYVFFLLKVRFNKKLTLAMALHRVAQCNGKQ